MIFYVISLVVFIILVNHFNHKRESSRRKFFKKVPFRYHIINFIGNAASLFGIKLVTLSKQNLIDKSLQTVGLKDFPNPKHWEKPLDLIIKNANDSSSGMSTVGLVLLQKQISRLLVNRLKVENFCKQNPQVFNIAINPVIIVGLPRTGTTLLYNLMATDPNCRAPTRWEMMEPYPPPRKQDMHSDPRIKSTERNWKWIPEEYKAIHNIDPVGYGEEVLIFLHSFWCYALGFWGKGFSDYREWTQSDVGKKEMYKDFLLFLKFLSFEFSPESHWCLKSPHHLFGNNFQHLMESFPNAKIVFTHRKLTTTVASSCSLFRSQCSWYTECYDPIAIGQIVLYELSNGMSNTLKYINKMPKDQVQKQIFDVQYQHLMQDPIEAVKEIYQHFGLKYTQQFEDNMKQWLKENPQGKHGRHEYYLEEYGLSEQTVINNFSEYIQKYKC